MQGRISWVFDYWMNSADYARMHKQGSIDVRCKRYALVTE
jgi:hypothetical protein